MQRLVYSPSVSAYVNTETGIVDISDFITAGTVNRVLNAVSTAELTIRNPQKMFTKPGDPTFRPMDGITIFASRYKSKPVQIFTGYLDGTPYLQLFPGTCTIRASCTLKRLLHTYWDSGVPHTLEFLSKFGWLPNPQTGTIFSQVGQTQSSGIQPGNGVSRAEVNTAVITDGSVGNLLWNVLFEIGKWDKNQIYIEKLPAGTIKTVADIMKTFEKDDDETEKELQGFLKDLIGDYTAGSSLSGKTGGGGTTSGGTGGSMGDTVPTGEDASPQQVAVAMLKAGFPKDAQIIANGLGTMFGDPGGGGTAPGESGGQAIYNGSCCYGYWQLNAQNSDFPGVDCANNLDCATKTALKYWSAGRCFNCRGIVNYGNPWQAGTDTGVKYLSLAQKIVNSWNG